MNRGEEVVADQALRQHDRVLEVVAVPGHEGDAHIASERQLAVIRGRPVGHDVALADALPGLHQRPLIDRRILIRAPELLQPVAVELGELGQGARIVGPVPSRVHNDLIGRDPRDPAVAPGGPDRARIPRHLLLEPRSHERRVRVQKRDGLPLHVGPHEGPVRVVVLEERDHRRGDRYQLVRRDVDIVDLVGTEERKVPPAPAEHVLVAEPAVVEKRGVGLCDRRLLLLVRRQPGDVFGDPSIDHLAVGRLDEAQVVDPGIGRQRRDQSDVGTLRGLDRTHAPVVGVVHVAHLEAGPLAGQPAGPERRQPPLVGQFGQGGWSGP